MKAIDRALQDLLLRLDLSRIVSMTNREEAREAFLVQHAEGGRKDPVFEYDRSAQIDVEFTPRLPFEETEEPEAILDLYRQKERELFTYARLLGSVGTNEFTRWAVDLFGAPTREQAMEAEEALKRLAGVGPPERTRSARELADRLERRLARFEVDFAVELDPAMFTKIMVNAAARCIRINSKVIFSDVEIERLVVHEVDVHVLRVVNGSKTDWGIFSLGTAGYREAEEGTAVYFEQKTGHLYPFQEKMYAGRCLAVHVALGHGFGDVFDALLPYFNIETAYYLAERTKRGLGDTSRPGALTKEFHYFSGPAKVESHFEGSDNLDLLWSGKIGFEDLPLVEALVNKGHMERSSWTIPWERAR